MTLPSYGIPGPEASLDAVRDIITANGQALQQVAMDAILPLAATVSNNDELLGLVRSGITKKLASQIGANTRGLNKVQQAVTQSLAAQTASVASSGNLAVAGLEGLRADTGGKPGNTVAAGCPDSGGNATLWMGPKGCYQTCQGHAAVHPGDTQLFTGQVNSPEMEAAIQNYCYPHTPAQPPGPTGPGGPFGPSYGVFLQTVRCELSVKSWYDASELQAYTLQGYMLVKTDPTWGYGDANEYMYVNRSAILAQYGSFCQGVGPPSVPGQPPQTAPAPQPPTVVPVPIATPVPIVVQGPTSIPLPAGPVVVNIDVCCPEHTQPGSPGLPRGSRPPSQPAPAPQQYPTATVPATYPAQPPTVPTPANQPIAAPQTKSFPCPQAPPQLANGFAAIGTPEFCSQIEIATQWVGSIGTSILDFIGKCKDLDALLTPDEPLITFDISKPTGFDASSLGDLLKFILKALYDLTRPVIDFLCDVYQCSRYWLQVLSGPCDSGTLLGINVVQFILSAFHRIRIGTDAFLWLTGDLEIQLQPIEQVLTYMRQYTCPMEPPEVFEAVRLWQADLIDETTLHCIFRIHGRDPAIAQLSAYESSQRLDPREAIQYARRQGWDTNQQLTLLRERGFTDPSFALAFLELYDELPTISDHLHWLQRNVFDQTYVDQYKLLDGFDTRFWPRFGKDLRALGMKEDYAKLHYAAHWIIPSPEQLREFVYRLRPDKAGVHQAFTPDDFYNLLAEQDYSPLSREWFKGTLYRVPALGYIRDMYRLGIIDDKQLVSYHQDLGYSSTDSTNFLASDKALKARQNASAGRGWSPAAISSAFITGLLSADEVRAKMSALGFTPQQSQDLMDRAQADYQYQFRKQAQRTLKQQITSALKEGIKIGILTAEDARIALQAWGWSAAQAKGWSDSLSAQARADLVKQGIAAIRKGYLGAWLSLDTARQQLTQLQVVPEVIQQYLTLWQLQFTPTRKRRTAAQTVNDVASGQLDTATALQRLLLLGYADADSRLFLADAQSKIAARQAKAKAAQLRDARTASKQLLQLKRQALRDAEKLAAKARSFASPATLKKWAKLGIVTQQEFFDAMLNYDFPLIDVERHWNEACSAKTAKCSPVQIASVGPGSSGSQPPTGSSPAAPGT